MMEESDRDILIRVDTNLKNVVSTLDAHIKKDEQINENFVLPMWNDYQQRQGAGKERKVGGALAGFAVNAGIAFATAWAAIKALGNGHP